MTLSTIFMFNVVTNVVNIPASYDIDYHVHGKYSNRIVNIPPSHDNNHYSHDKITNEFNVPHIARN